MSADHDTARPNRALVWAGRVISGVPVLMLLLSAVMKFNMSPEASKQMEAIGFNPKLAVPFGILELTCTILYAIPQTSVLGAILLTGYLGGAIVTHVRTGDGFFWIPAALGVLVWLGIFLRERRLRAILPWRT